MKRILLELLGGFVAGSLFASYVLLVVYAFLSPDPMYEITNERGKKSQCEAYEEILTQPHGPEDKEYMHIRELYAKLCEEKM